MATVLLDTATIKDEASFHSAFARLIGFPDFYGANMNAWIDCLSSLTDDESMSKLHLAANEQLVIEVVGFEEFLRREPALASEMMSCAAFVNRRYADREAGTRIAFAPIDRR